MTIQSLKEELLANSLLQYFHIKIVKQCEKQYKDYGSNIEINVGQNVCHSYSKQDSR
jgi:hypothetical protein